MFYNVQLCNFNLEQQHTANSTAVVHSSSAPTSQFTESPGERHKVKSVWWYDFSGVLTTVTFTYTNLRFWAIQGDTILCHGIWWFSSLKKIQEFIKRDSVISVNQQEKVQPKGKFILRNLTILHKTQLYYYLSNTWWVNMYSLHVWPLINDCNVTRTNWITLPIDFDFILHCSVPMHNHRPVHHHLQITSVCPTDFYLSSLLVPKASDGGTTQLRQKQFKDVKEQRHALSLLMCITEVSITKGKSCQIQSHEIRRFRKEAEAMCDRSG